MGFSVIPEPAISGFTGPQGPAGTIPSDPVFSGSMAVNDTSGDPNIDIKKNGLMRWKIRSAGTESGSNNGSDLWVEAFADDGTTKINDPIWISRTTGQVAIGIADSSQGGVKLSVNGAIGVRDTADPLTTGMGAQLYSKAGKLWVQTANGTDKFQVVESLPSKANATLNATYMSIDKSAGNYRVFRWMTDAVSRWEAQVDDVAEAGSAVGSDFRLSARNDDGTFNKTVIHAKRSDGTITFGTTTHHGSAQVTSAGAVGLRDITADPATATGGAFLYSKGGLAYVKQGDGTVFQLAAGGGTGAVASVNGKTGTVSLTASDVNALPSNADGATTGKVTAKAFETNSTQRSAFLKTTSSTEHAATIYQAATSGVDVAAALNVVSDNPESTALYLSGTESGRGTLKIAHRNPGPAVNADANAAGISIDLQYNGKAGTAAQGLFITGTDGPTTGNLITARNNGRDDFVVKADGKAGVRLATGATPAGALEINQGDTSTVGLAMTAASGGQQMLLLKDSGGNARFEVGATGSTVHRAVAFFTGAMQGGSTSSDLGGSSGFVFSMKDASTAPTTNPTGGVIAYSQGGVLKVRQADGTVVTVANNPTIPVTSVNTKTGDVSLTAADVSAIPTSQKAAASGVASLDSGTKVPIAQLPDSSVPSGFTPESIGLKAWAGDPAATASGFDYPGVVKGRMAAVYVNRSMSVSKIAWHMFGYAGGLLTGSWAGIYSTSGTLMRATGDMSTASYEPAEQHTTGGAVSTSNLTSAVTLAPGVYYVIWRFNYTASPVDGPALMRFDSASTCAAVYGATSVRRFGAFVSTDTSAPSTISPSWETDPLRFWVALV
jgi:hypothetical protein